MLSVVPPVGSNKICSCDGVFCRFTASKKGRERPIDREIDGETERQTERQRDRQRDR